MRCGISTFAVALLAVVLAACGTDSVAPDRSTMIAALTVLDGSGYHDRAERLGGPTPVINPADVGLVRRARVAAGLVNWPPDIMEKARAFESTSGLLEDALARYDQPAASAAVHNAHAAYHALSAAGWEYLSDLAGLPIKAS